MKATGIIRKVDELGRVVLPIEMRRVLNIAEKDMLEIYVEGDRVILSKYQNKCVFCNSEEGLTLYKDKPVCAACFSEIKGL